MPHLDDITDAELLREFSGSGSHAAFATLVNRHASMVHAVSMRVLNNHHDAQDVTQAVFLVLAQKAAKLSGQPSVGGWLHTASRNAALDVVRSRQRRKRREEAVMKESEQTIQDGNLRADFCNELDAALERLPDRYRQPLLLFHLEGASLKDVSKQLNLQPSTLRTRLARARNMLCDALKRRGVEIASATAFTTLLSAQAKACSKVFLSTVTDSATNSGVPASSGFHEIAARISATNGANTTTTSIFILMKTKAAYSSAIAIVLLAAGLTTYVRIQHGDETSSKNQTKANLPLSDETRESSTKFSNRNEVDPLSLISNSDEFRVLSDSVLLIADDAERLAAIREKLGMNLSDEVYRHTIEAHGYRVNPKDLIHELLMAWGKDDPESATLWSRRFPSEFGNQIAELMLAFWIMKDRSAAMTWATDNIPSDHIDKAMRRQEKIESKTARESSDATNQRLHSLHDSLLKLRNRESANSNEMQSLTSSLDYQLQTWAKRDPAAAVTFWTSLDEKTKKGIYLKPLFENWAHDDPDAALEQAERLTNETERIDALKAVLPSWQLKHRDRTIDEAIDLDTLPDQAFNSILHDLVGVWATADPAAAMDYSMKLEQPKLQRMAVARSVEAWAVKSPSDAEQWVSQLPSGNLRDIGYRELSERAIRTNYDLAAHFVRKIEDPDAKKRTIGKLSSRAEFRSNLPDSLDLMREMNGVDHLILESMASTVSTENEEIFRVWLEKAHADDFIEYPEHDNPDVVEPEAVKAFNEKRRTRAMNAYSRSLRITSDTLLLDRLYSIVMDAKKLLFQGLAEGALRAWLGEG